MRTTLDLPDPLFRTLKSRAALDGVSLKELVVGYLQLGLSQSAPSAAAGQRAPFPVLIDGPLNIPVEQLSNAGIHALLDAEDDERSGVLMHGDHRPDGRP